MMTGSIIHPKNNIKILIVDDHPVIIIGIKALISTEPGMHVVGETSSSLDVLKMVRERCPDVILLDLIMPHKSGVNVIRELKQLYPKIRILVLTSYGDRENIMEAVKAGSDGYLLKDSAPEQLLQAIRDVYHGQSSVHPRVARELIREITEPFNPPSPLVESLTHREMEVLKFVAEGLSNQEIGQRLYISERTVRTHVSSILGKLNLENRTQAALYALKAGLCNLLIV